MDASLRWSQLAWKISTIATWSWNAHVCVACCAICLLLSVIDVDDTRCAGGVAIQGVFTTERYEVMREDVIRDRESAWSKPPHKGRCRSV